MTYKYVAIIDDDGTITHVSKKFSAIFGYRDGELVGQKIECIVPPDVVGRHVKLRQDFCDDAHDVIMSLRGYTKSQKEFDVKISLLPITASHGQCIMVNVAEYIPLEEQLKRLQGLKTKMSELVGV